MTLCNNKANENLQYVIGFDYGTNSCRAILMLISSPTEITSCVFNYPSGDAGVMLSPKDPHLARQNPQDYIDGLTVCTRKILHLASKIVPGFRPSQVCAIGFATTGSTIIPVDKNNTPLAFNNKYTHNLNAHAWLWKDHSSVNEAKKITQLAAATHPEYLDYCGGSYSSEWFWSKILHLRNIDPCVFEQAYSYIELCDFLPAVLAGINDPTQIKRSACAAGHKALYHNQWGGLPDSHFLTQCDPALATLKDRLYHKTHTCNQSAGVINEVWARKTGLSPGTQIAVGIFDAHSGAIGAGIRENKLVKIIGTSALTNKDIHLKS